MGKISAIRRIAGSIARGGSSAAKTATIAGMSSTITTALGAMVSKEDNQQLAHRMSRQQRPQADHSNVRNSDYLTPSFGDIFNNLTIISKVPDIVPELGPEDAGPYAEHFNLLISRVAKLESRVARTNAIVQKLQRAVSDQTEFERQQELHEAREEDERVAEEKKTVKQTLSTISGRAKDVASVVGSVLGRYLVPLGLGLGLGGGAYAIQASDVTGGLDNIDRYSEYAVKGVQSARAVAQMAIGTGAAQPGRLFNAAASAMRVSTAGAGSFGPTAPAMQTLQTAGRSAKHVQMLNSIKWAQRAFANIATKSKAIGKQVGAALAKLPAAIGRLARKWAKKIVKWYLVGEAFVVMINATERYLLGTIDEQKWHSSNRTQINRILSLLGPPWALGVIGSLVGATFPPLGLVGGAAGVIAGVIWGDEIYKAIGMHRVADALYDMIFLQDMTGMKNVWTAVRQFAVNAWSDLVVAKASSMIEGAVNVIEDPLSAFETQTSTEEEIRAKYGRADTPDIIAQATRGIGTDEGALLYAASNIKSSAHLARIEKEFKQRHDRSLDDVLRSELSANQYDKFQSIVQTQIQQNRNKRMGLQVVETIKYVSSEQAMRRQYGEKRGADLVHDVLGHGAFNLAGDKGDVYAAFRNVTWPKYRDIESKYGEKYDRSLTRDLNDFLGTGDFDKLVNMISAQTANEAKNVAKPSNEDVFTTFTSQYRAHEAKNVAKPSNKDVFTTFTIQYRARREQRTNEQLVQFNDVKSPSLITAPIIIPQQSTIRQGSPAGSEKIPAGVDSTSSGRPTRDSFIAAPQTT